jgi:hypothetical protein
MTDETHEGHRPRNQRRAGPDTRILTNAILTVLLADQVTNQSERVYLTILAETVAQFLHEAERIQYYREQETNQIDNTTGTDGIERLIGKVKINHHRQAREETETRLTQRADTIQDLLAGYHAHSQYQHTSSDDATIAGTRLRQIVTDILEAYDHELTGIDPVGGTTQTASTVTSTGNPATDDT